MKRFVTLILFICMILSVMPALADNEYYGDMEVVNCQEWVSLRESPSTRSERLVKVSLGAIISNCRQVNDKWIYGTYDGYCGYILAEYLEPSNGRITFSAMMITYTDGAPFYPTLDSKTPVDYIPANTIVRNCRIMDNGLIYVEWGSRCGFINLMHAEVYNEMLHFPRQITLHTNLFGSGYEEPLYDIKISDGEDFPIKKYDFSSYEYDTYMEADGTVPKVTFVLHTDTVLNHVHLFSIELCDMDYETGEATYTATLENIQYQLDSEHPLFVGAVIWGDMPNLAVGYADSQGVYHFAFIEISGEDGNLILRAF